jgi:hypothetical protein
MRRLSSANGCCAIGFCSEFIVSKVRGLKMLVSLVEAADK